MNLHPGVALQAQPPPAVTYTVDEQGIGWIVFDHPGSSANIFDLATEAAFAAALAALADRRLQALVLTSAKERIFVAGADLRRLGELADARAAERFSREGHRLFQAVADFPAPVIAAIHGACVGGGYELALACHWRIASDDASTRIGLPEIGLGTLPGWGGTTRLPRLIGAPAALNHILKAQLEPATAALKSGLVDEVVSRAELKSRAQAAALSFAQNGGPKRALPAIPAESFFSDLRLGNPESDSARQSVRNHVIDVVQQGIELPFEKALALEAQAFGAVTPTDHCKSQVRAFFLSKATKTRSAHEKPADSDQGNLGRMTKR